MIQLESRDDAPLADPLRVLVVYCHRLLWSMGEGKGANSFTRTLETLAARGHEVRVSLPAEPGAPSVVETYRGFHLHRAETPISFNPRADLPMPLRIWKRVTTWAHYQSWAVRTALALGEEMRPDLVISLGAFEAPAAHEVAQILGVPNVTRLYGVTTPYRSRLRQIANFPERVAMETPTFVMLITNDGSEGDHLARAYHVPEDKIVFLRNGFDLERFTPGPGSSVIRAHLGVAPDQPLLLTVTRLAQEKKLERAIDAMPAILERLPNAVLTLVGDGDQREFLVERARTTGVTEHVRFAGAVLQNELPDWYRSADFLLSLLDRTNAANPVYEALACGLPVVALDRGATREIIRTGENGVLVARDDLPRLGSIIADWLERPDRRARMGERAAQEMRQLLVSPSERLAYEMDLFESAARRLPIPRWLQR